MVLLVRIWEMDNLFLFNWFNIPQVLSIVFTLNLIFGLAILVLTNIGKKHNFVKMTDVKELIVIFIAPRQFKIYSFQIVS